MSVASLIVAIVALGISGMFASLQYRHDKFQATPKVSIDASHIPVGAYSWPSRDQGMFAEADPKARVHFVACVIASSGSATIAKAGVMLAGSRLKDDATRFDLTDTAYVGDANNPDTGRREAGKQIAQIPDEYEMHRLPAPLTDSKIVLRLDVNDPVNTVRSNSSVRIWVETSTKHCFVSEPVMLNQTRYRGIVHLEGDNWVPGQSH